MIKALSVLDWKTLLLEMIVIFIGLLAALEVDDWREEKLLQDMEARYLVRLQQDLAESKDIIQRRLERASIIADNVFFTAKCLQAGEIIDWDQDTFEKGLSRYGVLPSAPLVRATYEEMLASGMLSRLESDELKRELSSLYATEERVLVNFAWWREQADVVDAILINMVDIEPERMTYNFEELAASRELKNAFWGIHHTHTLWLSGFQSLEKKAGKLEQLLNKELESK